jgi:hypothetical protein
LLLCWTAVAAQNLCATNPCLNGGVRPLLFPLAWLFTACLFLPLLSFSSLSRQTCSTTNTTGFVCACAAEYSGLRCATAPFLTASDGAVVGDAFAGMAMIGVGLSLVVARDEVFWSVLEYGE